MPRDRLNAMMAATAVMCVAPLQKIAQFNRWRGCLHSHPLAPPLSSATGDRAAAPLRCGVERPLLYSARWRSMATWVGSKKTEYHRNRRLETVAWLASLRDECVHCGEADPVVLDFHHRDASQKKFQLIGSLCYSRSREAILSEVAKCDVLCANCHRREEHKIRCEKSSVRIGPAQPDLTEQSC